MINMINDNIFILGWSIPLTHLSHLVGVKQISRFNASSAQLTTFVEYSHFIVILSFT